LDATAQLAPTETGSDGLAVETYVLARLLGLKLLTLEGLVLVSPAEVRHREARSSAPREPASVDAEARSTRSAIPDGHGPGSGLAGAARLLEECTEELRTLTTSRVTNRPRSGA
jgi:hypothetical protein